MRWCNLLGYGLVVLVALLWAMIGVARAGGLEASFTSSSDPCGSDPSLVFCYTGDIDTSGNLVDHSGENLLTDRTEFDDWGESGTCAVTADQWRSPVTGLMTADYLDNTGAVAGGRYNTAAVGITGGRTFTASVWVRADYDHTASIRVYESGGDGSMSEVENISVTKMWQRFFVTGVANGTTTTNIRVLFYPGEKDVLVGQAYFSDVLLVENDRYRTNAGIYLNPADQSITKPDHDLAPSNSPSRALSDAEYQGNRLPARNFVAASTQYYSKAHHDSMNVNDTDHTYTFYIRATDTTQRRFFEHGTYQVDGVYFEMLGAGSGTIRAQYNSSGSNAAVSYTGVDPEDQSWHIVQLVRNDDIATIYIDGNAGTPVDVTGEGIDGSKTLYIANSVTGSTSWDGDIAFAKLEAFARNADQLASDREKIWGMSTGLGSINTK